ncbi:MAG: TonB-dependent receptor [Acidobacteriota bacterium]|nr:TonB-dependent receptor [Acidobacteriota bacterium]
MVRLGKTVLLGLAVLLLAQVPAQAQIQTGSILIHLKDAQGGALPGATITISSPVLVAGSMTGVTDSTGVYRFPSLFPGTYEVKIELQGFATLMRPGIIVSVGQTTPLELQMELAKVEQSVTVTGESPTVDTTSATVSTTLSKQLLESTPGGRDIWSMAEYKIPGLATNRPDVGGDQGGLQAGMSARGTSNGQNTQYLNGINVGDPAAIGYTQFYYDYDAFQEIQVSVGAIDLSVPSGGVFMNMVTKSGTDEFHGSGSFYWQGHQTQSSNIDSALENQGLAPSAGNVDFVSDANFQLGGPIVKHKLQFFTSFRDWRVHVNVPGFPQIEQTNITSGIGNFTYQLNQNNRFTGFVSRQKYYKPNRGASAFNTPASDWKEDDTTSIYQGLWNSVLSSHAFLDARISYNDLLFPLYLKSTDVSTYDLATNITSGANTVGYRFLRKRLQTNANLSYYVDNFHGTRHEFRVGIDYAHAPTVSDQTRNGDILQYTLNGAPAYVTEYNTPVDSAANVDTFAVFGQDSISVKNWTINGGLRYQRTNGYLPAQSSPAGTFAPARSFSAVNNVITWNTVSPRVGVIYDVTGDGKTAIKASAARYYYTLSTGTPNTVNLNGSSYQQYVWNDLNGDGKFQPNETGALVAVGGANISSFNPNLKQPYTNEVILGIDRELMPDFRLSVTGTYRQERNQFGPINTAVTAASYTPMTVVDPGPDGVVGTADDSTLTVYNQDPATLALTHLYYTNSAELNQDYKGIEITATKRLSHRWQMLAGYTYGKATQDNTYVGIYNGSAALNDPNTLINSKGATFFDRPQTFKLTGSYLFPHGILFSANIRAQSGTPWSNTSGAPFRVLRVKLNQGNTVIFANAPGTVRTPAIKTMDIRLAKSFRLGNGTLEASFDAYNLFNAATAYDWNPFTGVSRVTNPVTGVVNTYPSFGLPTGLLGPRIMRLGISYTF